MQAAVPEKQSCSPSIRSLVLTGDVWARDTHVGQVGVQTGTDCGYLSVEREGGRPL